MKTNFDSYLNEQLKDTKFAEQCENAGAAWDIAVQLVALRKDRNISQKELADSVGTTQQQISRLESPSYEGHSLSMLRKVAAALGTRVHVTLSNNQNEHLTVAESMVKYTTRTNMDKPENKELLVSDIKKIIEDGRNYVAQAINTGLTTTYWHIGKRINCEVLNNKRAEYGKQIVASLAQQLTIEYGKGWSIKQLQHCLRFAEAFPDIQIVSALRRQLSWTHFRALIYLKTDLEREFYAQMCRIERWNTRTLQKKIDSMLFERTAISKKPEELAKIELQTLQEEDRLSPDLVFKDHYVLDFLNLKDTYSENDLEQSILKEIENFILELGVGFTFVARQKRMIIDNADFKLDLLFYHRKLKRLVAIDLKIGKFKASYKGQMELYLRWLEKNETEPDEEKPIGLILCAEGSHEQVELLQLDKVNIKVAEYITKYIPKEMLIKKLHQFAETAKKLIEARNEENIN